MNTADFHIRTARINDIDEIYEIEMQSHGRWKKDFFLKELSTPFSIFVAAEQDKRIVGFAIAWNITGEIQLNNISVKKEYRRRGIGTSLLNHVIGMLRANSPQLINLEVNANNKKAKSFYTHFGFRESGIRKKYYDEDDALLMIKEL